MADFGDNLVLTCSHFISEDGIKSTRFAFDPQTVLGRANSKVPVNTILQNRQPGARRARTAAGPEDAPVRRRFAGRMYEGSEYWRDDLVSFPRSGSYRFSARPGAVDAGIPEHRVDCLWSWKTEGETMRSSCAVRLRPFPWAGLIYTASASGPPEEIWDLDVGTIAAEMLETLHFAMGIK